MSFWKNNFKVLLPIYFSIAVVIGIFIGTVLNSNGTSKKSLFSSRVGKFKKLNEVINYIEQDYVDTINERKVVEQAITSLLHELDPHSVYIPASEAREINEPLEGNFEGIGVEFHIQDDTIIVISAISGGPSETVGIQSGDRIVKIEGKIVAGVKISNNDVIKKLRGTGGTKVTVGIAKQGSNKINNYTITRGKIPIYSVDVGYMVDDKTGYIKINRFATSTYDEFMEKLRALKKVGMKNLILDLKDNPGGFLTAATKIADEFLDGDKLIVYTQGKARKKTEYRAGNGGEFLKGKLVVLIDEGSASASEIVAGALQDWDRATIIGRRSFGKGLVQEPINFPDGSEIRLTVARYYTPLGRSIQRSYKDGAESYYEDVRKRATNGELESVDSIKLPDSLKYTTPGGRTVYGGGGIMPEKFVPIDTLGNSIFLFDVVNKGIISEYSYKYLDQNRATIEGYKTFTEFDKHFEVTDDLYNKFVAYALKQGAEKDEKGIKISAFLIKTQLKALIARQVWKNEGFYPVIHRIDETVKKAIEVINSSK
jgi:carboxyl-terminal processing protease